MAELKNYKTGADTYTICTEEIAAGANKVFWDLFNPANGTSRILIYEIDVLPKTDVAVTGTLGVKFDFSRTNSAGTGGTACNWENSTPPVMWRHDRATSLDFGSFIAAALFRSAPSGGANIVHYMFRNYIFSEETNAATNTHQHFSLLPGSPNALPIVLNPGEGMVCVQGAVASVNSYTFRITFGVDDRD